MGSLLRLLGGRRRAVGGGDISAASLDELVSTIASTWTVTNGPQAGGTFTINSVSLGSYDYVVVPGGTTISSFEAASYFTDTEDSRFAIIVAKGNLTINDAVIPGVRKLGCIIGASGTITGTGSVSMTARGADHSAATGSNVTAGNIRVYSDLSKIGAPPTWPAFGSHVRGLNFDGSSDYVNLGNTPLYDDTAVAMSITVLAYIDASAQPTVYNCLYGEGRNVGLGYVFLAVKNSAGVVRVTVNDDSNTQTIASDISSAVTDQAWNVITLVLDAAGTGWGLVVNGVEVQALGTAYASAPATTTLTTAAIGALPRSSVTNYFDGPIAYVMRHAAALTLTQCQQVQQAIADAVSGDISLSIAGGQSANTNSPQNTYAFAPGETVADSTGSDHGTITPGSYVNNPQVPAAGGAGGAGVSGTNFGNDATDGSSGGTGGGGSGGVFSTGSSGDGAAGTCFSGGSASGGSALGGTGANASADGGPGSDATGGAAYKAGGGAGNPGGAGVDTGEAGESGTGGLLYVICSTFAGTLTLSANGADGGDSGIVTNSGNGGGSGGGGVHVLCDTDSSSATLTATGGLGGTNAQDGGDGGDGTTRIMVRGS